MESRVRKNTVKLVFPNGSKTPAQLEVLKFTLTVLKIPAASLHSVYKDENENRFYLKFIDETKFADFVNNLEESYSFRYDDGTVVKVSLEMASRIFRYVRIFSLPPEIEDKDIAHVLGQFGTIRQHVRERFAAEHGVAIYTGVRGVHMEVAKDIPPHIYIGHFRARIFYDGLKNKCFLCKGEGHIKANCPRLLVGASGSGSSSYAGVTAQSRPTENLVGVVPPTTQPDGAAGPSTSSPKVNQPEPVQLPTSGQQSSAVQENNERSELANNDPPIQPQETQPNDQETMEIDEAKMAQKRAAARTSSEEEGLVDDEGFIKPKEDLTPAHKHPNLLYGVILVTLLTVFSLFIFKQKETDYLLESPSKNFTPAINLTESVRVLCYMQTTPSTAETKAIHGKHTWGRRCNKMLLMSSKANEKVGAIGLNAGEGRNNLANKTFEALEYLYEHHLNEFDWFMKMDDDSYVIMENLRYFLYPYSPEFPIFFGSKLQVNGQVYFSGGSGYVLSREALRRFVEKAVKSPNNCTSKTDHEDVQIGRCMQYVNVTAADTRDSLQRERFLPDKPEYFFDTNPAAIAQKWYTRLAYYNPTYGQNCCSDMAISFHYITPMQMYSLDYLLYQLRPYGLQHSIPELPPKKSWEEAKIVPLGRFSPKPAGNSTMETDGRMSDDVLDVAKLVVNGTSIDGIKMDHLIERLLNNKEFKDKITKKLNNK